jgi:hypothetical protein
MSSKDWRPTAFVDTAPGVVTEEEAGAGRRAQRRSIVSFLQRLVALDTAALLVVVALLDKAFAQPQRREWAAVAVAALVLGVVVGGIATLALNAGAPHAGARRPANPLRAGLAAAGAAFLCFVVGIAALAAFFLVNWLR